MTDPLGEFIEKMEISQEEGPPRGSRKYTPGGFLDLLTYLFTAGFIGVGLLFVVIFIHPQSRFNPLPPTTLPALPSSDLPSAAPRSGLPPTWTPTISPTDNPVLTPVPTAALMKVDEYYPDLTADLENTGTISKQAGSPMLESDAASADAGSSLPEGPGQVAFVSDLPVSAQLTPRLYQPQLASVLNAPLPEKPSLAEAFPAEESISDLFTPEIQYWEEEILAWAEEYELDPNLIAAVMQIESCGYIRAKSAAGAMGLFQVMPHHFKNREDPYEPETNAYRGLSWLQQTLRSGGSTAMALASYNAGIARAKNTNLDWPAETRRYVFWGMNLYQDASDGYEFSYALENWLSKGGAALCSRAAAEQQGEQ